MKLLGFMAFAGLLAVGAGAGEINFDGTGAPCNFSQTSSLTNYYYSSLGVYFEGPGAGLGGAILNQCGNFGVNAHSGEEFLAFNRNLYATDPETIGFSQIYTDISIWGASGNGTATFRIDGYNGASIVDTMTATSTGGWIQLAISDPSGFDSVKLTQIGSDNAWVYDDLVFTPEPASLSLLVLSGLWLLRRR